MILKACEDCTIEINNEEFDCITQYYDTGVSSDITDITIEHIAIVVGTDRYDADYLMQCSDIVEELKHQICLLED